jgi:hypothetical protein
VKSCNGAREAVSGESDFLFLEAYPFQPAGRRIGCLEVEVCVDKFSARAVFSQASNADELGFDAWARVPAVTQAKKWVSANNSG